MASQCMTSLSTHAPRQADRRASLSALLIFLLPLLSSCFPSKRTFFLLFTSGFPLICIFFSSLLCFPFNTIFFLRFLFLALNFLQYAASFLLSYGFPFNMIFFLRFLSFSTCDFYRYYHFLGPSPILFPIFLFFVLSLYFTHFYFMYLCIIVVLCVCLLLGR